MNAIHDNETIGCPLYHRQSLILSSLKPLIIYITPTPKDKK